jgi:hypothetical protein
MKGFNRWLIVAIIFAIVYYVGWHDDQENVQQGIVPAPPQQTVQVEAPPSPPTPANADSMEARLLPPWPPAEAGDEALVLADSLTMKNFVLILDGSGSMAKQGCSGNRSKHEVAREAVIAWAALVPEDANLGLIVFDRQGFSTRLPLGLANRPQFKAEVEKVIPEGKTPLAIAVDTAHKMLTGQGSRQLGYGDYTVVIVTDGVADDIAALDQSVNKVLATSPIIIHTIGFCIESDHSLNRAGRTTYRAANNPAELRQGLQEVLAEAETFDIDGFK